MSSGTSAQSIIVANIFDCGSFRVFYAQPVEILAFEVSENVPSAPITRS